MEVVENKMKYISILGDSISTLKGYLPSYCKSYYMQNPAADCSGISHPWDTWWIQVISALHGELCVNNSYSGSLVCGMDFPSATHLLRCNELHCSAGSYWYAMERGIIRRTLSTSLIMPDMIIVFLGANDWIFHSAIDEETEQKLNFRFAYRQVLEKLQRRYPDAVILCTTLFQKESVIANPRHPLAAYNQVIRELAAEQGCLLADIAQYAEEIETIDGIHPTYQGMHAIYELWLRSTAQYNLTD